jgi:ribosome maturation factor RimP
MAKAFDSVKSFIGKEVVIEYIQSGSEEITGEVKSNKDGVVTLQQDFRGSTYVYRIPATEVLFIKGGESEFSKGATVTLERSINKRVKIKGTLVGIDALGLIVDRGEVRGRLTTQVISANTFESITYGELTAEGKKKRDVQSKRLKEARGDKPKKKKSKK